MAEIQRVSSLFRELFGVDPGLRVMGRFGEDARGAEPATAEMAEWWAKLGAAWCPVVREDGEWLCAQPFYGATRAVAIPVSPFRGTAVRVRLFLP